MVARVWPILAPVYQPESSANAQELAMTASATNVNLPEVLANLALANFMFFSRRSHHLNKLIEVG